MLQSILLEVERIVITSVKAVQNSVKTTTSDKTAAHLGSKQIRQNTCPTYCWPHSNYRTNLYIEIIFTST